MDEKEKRLSALKNRSYEVSKSQEAMSRAFVEAVKAKATIQELSDATGLSVDQVRYQARKNNLSIIKAQRGPKQHSR